MPAPSQRATSPAESPITSAASRSARRRVVAAWDVGLTSDVLAADVVVATRPPRRPLSERLALGTVGLLTAGALLAGMATSATGEELAAITGLTSTTEAPAAPTSSGEAEAAPAPTPEPAPAPEPAPEPEPTPAAAPSPAPEAGGEAAAAPAPAPEPALEVAPLQAAPEPAPEAVAAPEPTAAPGAEPAPAVEPAPASTEAEGEPAGTPAAVTPPADDDATLKAAPTPAAPPAVDAPAVVATPRRTERPVHRPTDGGPAAGTSERRLPAGPRTARPLDSGALADLVAARQAAQRRAATAGDRGAVPGTGTATDAGPDLRSPADTPGSVPTWGPTAGVSSAAFLRVSPLLPAPVALPEIELLTPAQGDLLRAVARDHGVSWTLLAAVARLESGLGSEPGVFAGRRLPDATGDAAASLPVLAAWLRARGAGADPSRPFSSEDALKAYFAGHPEAGREAERVAALAAYYYALTVVGAERGLGPAADRLGDRTVADRDILLYPGGRRDVELGLVDPRVLLVVRYLEASFGSVRVSSLIDGHRIFSSSGNVSAHVYGRAVDVAELGGVNLIGHMGPGSVTERAARLLLLLPKEVAPRQIISLVDLDGPTGATGTFALADHWDHLHIGF